MVLNVFPFIACWKEGKVQPGVSQPQSKAYPPPAHRSVELRPIWEFRPVARGFIIKSPHESAGGRRGVFYESLVWVGG